MVRGVGAVGDPGRYEGALGSGAIYAGVNEQAKKAKIAGKLIDAGIGS